MYASKMCVSVIQAQIKLYIAPSRFNMSKVFYSGSGVNRSQQLAFDSHQRQHV